MNTDNTQDKLLTPAEVADRLGLKNKETALYMSRDGQIPAALRITRKCLRWRESEINNFIAKLGKANIREYCHQRNDLLRTSPDYFD